MVHYTAKNVIGNRFSRLKIASLLIKNIISSIGIVFATHSVLFYIKDSKKNIATKPMGENPLVSDGKQFTSSLMVNADNLSENVDAGNARHKNFPTSFSHSATQTPF